VWLGDSASAAQQPERVRGDTPFAVAQWHKYRAEANTATKRRWVIDFAYWWGGSYDGTRRQTGLGLTLKLRPRGNGGFLRALQRGCRNPGSARFQFEYRIIVMKPMSMWNC
jgi:hypothetical protein